MLEQAKREALHEAMVISQLGDHHGIPHLFGVCTDKAPFYLVLQFYSVDGQTSSTLTESLKNGNIKEASDCVSVLRNIVETLTFIHSQGYVHNDLKGNNVLLTRSPSGTLRPIIIDFGKSEEIASARLQNLKLISQEQERIFLMLPRRYIGVKGPPLQVMFSRSVHLSCEL